MSGVFHGGGIAAAARRFEIPAERWLDLSTGINPVTPDLPSLPSSLFQRLPDADLLLETREAAGRFYGSGAVLPIASPGTQAMIRILAGQIAKSRVAIVSPTYGEYRAVFGAAGHRIDEVAELSGISAVHDVVIIVNPNNPDGRRYSRADLIALSLDLAGRGATLIVDEAFGDLYPEASLARDVAHHPHLIVLKSLGKFFGLAGLRLSFAVCGEPYADALEEGLGPWPVSGLALAIARHCLALDPEPLRMEIRRRAAEVEAVLKAHRLRVAANAGLFLLVETPQAHVLHDHLCRSAILTRVFDIRTDWIRLGLPADAEGLARLDAALSNWSGP